MLHLKNAILNGERRNILIDKGLFVSTNAPESVPDAEETVDCAGAAVLPAFFNAHTHNAMTLMRGYADDICLDEWLRDYIWPFEEKLTPDDIRHGSELAAREMIHTGSVAMNDMYFDIEQTIDVTRKYGLRALIGITVMDNHSLSESRKKMDFVKEWKDPTGGRIKLAMAPHSLYTVGKDNLVKTAAFAREHGIKIHIHVAETRLEVENCLRDHGMTPVRYLDSIGVLGPDVIAAHCVHVDREDWDILAERGVTAVNCPCSNMKIASGRFHYEEALASGAKIALGTDGCCSNNNLDLREEMKFATLLAKVAGDPTLLPAPEALKWATRNGAEAMGFDSGLVEEGRLADCILVDMSAPAMNPCHNIVSNWVYAADPSCVKAVICDGKVLESK